MELDTEKGGGRVTPERFAKGMTFDGYLQFIGSPELAREGWDIRRFSTCRPRVDWSGYLRKRRSRGAARRRTGRRDQVAGRASSDCRRDLPYLGRLAEAGGLELRLFLRDAETMHGKGLPEPASSPNADLVREYANEKDGKKFASIPAAVFFTRDEGALRA